MLEKGTSYIEADFGRIEGKVENDENAFRQEQAVEARESFLPSLWCAENRWPDQ